MNKKSKQSWSGLDWDDMREVYAAMRKIKMWDTGMFKALVKLDHTGHAVVEALDDIGNILPPVQYTTIDAIPDPDVQHKLKLLMWVDEHDQEPRAGVGTRVGKHNFWIEK